MTKPAPKNIIISSISVILILILLSFGYLTSAERRTASKLQSDYNQEANALGGLVGALGVTRSDDEIFQCSVTQTTHTQTHERCEDFARYSYNSQPISASAKQNYAANAAKLDALLKSRGWSNDRPHDAITTLAASNPYSAQNGGVGGSVPFHKNVGAVSCNFEITFSGLSSSASATPGAINVNQFSCQQNISFAALHIDAYTRQSNG